MAAGQFDGIYANTQSNVDYLSIHTNGSTIIAAQYTWWPASGIFARNVLGTVYPKQMNTWDLYNGSIDDSGNAVLSGEGFFNSCFVNLAARFSGGNLHVTILSAVQTLAGQASNVSCGLLHYLYPNGFDYVRAF
jgi:hypothetical protein